MTWNRPSFSDNSFLNQLYLLIPEYIVDLHRFARLRMSFSSLKSPIKKYYFSFNKSKLFLRIFLDLSVYSFLPKQTRRVDCHHKSRGPAEAHLRATGRLRDIRVVHCRLFCSGSKTENPYSQKFFIKVNNLNDRFCNN